MKSAERIEQRVHPDFRIDGQCGGCGVETTVVKVCVDRPRCLSCVDELREQIDELLNQLDDDTVLRVGEPPFRYYREIEKDGKLEQDFSIGAGRSRSPIETKFASNSIGEAIITGTAELVPFEQYPNTEQRRNPFL